MAKSGGNVLEARGLGDDPRPAYKQIRALSPTVGLWKLRRGGAGRWWRLLPTAWSGDLNLGGVGWVLILKVEMTNGN